MREVQELTPLCYHTELGLLSNQTSSTTRCPSSKKADFVQYSSSLHGEAQNFSSRFLFNHNMSVHFLEIYRQADDINLDEERFGNVLTGISGVKGFWNNSTTSTLLIEFDTKKTNAYAILRSLVENTLTPTFYRFHTFPVEKNQTPAVDPAHLFLSLETKECSFSEIQALQNDILNLQGVVYCFYWSKENRLQIVYDAATVSVRALFSHICQGNAGKTHGFRLTFRSSGLHRLPSLISFQGRMAVDLYCNLLLLIWIILTHLPPVSQGLNTPFLHCFFFCLNLIIVASSSIRLTLRRMKRTRILGVYSLITFAGLATLVNMFVSFFSLIVVIHRESTSSSAIEMFEERSLVIGLIMCNARQFILIFSLWRLITIVSTSLKSFIRDSFTKHESVLCDAETCRLMDPSGMKIVENLSPNLVEKADILLFKRGEYVQFDGLALCSAVLQPPTILPSEHMLNGVCHIQEGDKVWAGSRVIQGSFQLKVNQVGSTMLSATLCKKMNHPPDNNILMQKKKQLYVSTYGILALIFIFVTLLYILFNQIIHVPLQGKMMNIAINILFCGCCYVEDTSPQTNEAIRTAGLFSLDSIGSLFSENNFSIVDLVKETQHFVITHPSVFRKRQIFSPHIALCNTRLLSLIKLFNFLNLPESITQKVCHVSVLDHTSDLSQESLNIFWFLIYVIEDAYCNHYSSFSHTEKKDNVQNLAFLLRETSKQYIDLQKVSSQLQSIPFNVSQLDEDGIQLNVSPSSRFTIGPLCIMESHALCLFDLDSQDGLLNRFVKNWAQEYYKNAHDVIFLAYNSLLLGALHLPCTLGKDIPDTIRSLQRNTRLTIWLCVSSNEQCNTTLSHKTGIPLEKITVQNNEQSKIHFIKNLQRESHSPVGVVTDSSQLVRTLSQNEDPTRPHFFGLAVHMSFSASTLVSFPILFCKTRWPDSLRCLIQIVQQTLLLEKICWIGCWTIIVSAHVLMIFSVIPDSYTLTSSIFILALSSHLLPLFLAQFLLHRFTSCLLLTFLFQIVTNFLKLKYDHAVQYFQHFQKRPDSLKEFGQL